MHISRVAIQNFRNFRSIDLGDLPAGLVLVGENAVGKSNFLYALRLLLDPSFPETSRQLVADDFWDGLDKPFDGHEIIIVVELTDFDNDKAAKAVLGEFLVEHSPHRARLTFVYRPIGESAANESDYEVVIFGGVDEMCRVGRSEWRYISLRVLPALRDAESSLRSQRSPLRRLINRTPADEDVLADVAIKMDEAAGTLTETDELQAIAASISDRLEAMVGKLFSVETSLGVTSTRPDQLLRSLRLFVDSERRRGIEQASLGTANLLFLTLLLEDIGAQRSAGEIVELILGVEEPEAHLHPHVQRVLFRQLLDTDRALVVTTHSPQIASVTPLESLVLLRNSNGESSAYRAAAAGLTSNQRADLERYLDVTRAEMLFARIVILVEGLAELYLVPAFAEDLGLDLDASGVSVSSVHGTDFVPYKRLLSSGGLDIPSVVITDGDPTKAGAPAGIPRASKLMTASAAAEVDAMYTEAEYDEARAACATEGIMIGDVTLEVDLIPFASDALSNAYDELVESRVMRKRFRSDMALAGTDLDARAKWLRRIERVGKGRFAQRLAEHVAGVAAPPHIASALERVQQLVDESSAPTESS